MFLCIGILDAWSYVTRSMCASGAIDNTLNKNRLHAADWFDFDPIFIEKYSVQRMWFNHEKLLSHRYNDDNGETTLTDLREIVCEWASVSSFCCGCVGPINCAGRYFNIPHTVSYCADQIFRVNAVWLMLETVQRTNDVYGSLELSQNDFSVHTEKKTLCSGFRWKCRLDWKQIIYLPL